MDDPFAPPEAEVKPAEPSARKWSWWPMIFPLGWLAIGGLAAFPSPLFALASAFGSGWLELLAAIPTIVPGMVISGLHDLTGLPLLKRGLFWDAAHSPPYLTLLGVSLVYVVPGAIGLAACVIARRRSKPARA